MLSTAYWNYFLSLERDFIKTLDFVELTSANSSAYGDNFAKLLLATGSEVDAVCKALCQALNPGSKAHNIVGYKSTITASFSRIHEASVFVDRTDAKITPWETWDPKVSQSPSWWTAYNEVKHNRVLNITSASQENVLFALCGLLIVNMYYHDVAGFGCQWPDPALLDAGRIGVLFIDSRDKQPPGVKWELAKR